MQVCGKMDTFSYPISLPAIVLHSMGAIIKCKRTANDRVRIEKLTFNIKTLIIHYSQLLQQRSSYRDYQ